MQRRRKSYVEMYEEEEFDVRLERRRSTRQHGLGLTVAGGGGSHPYQPGEDGIFAARVVPGGAADVAGVQVDDEILAINNIPCYQLDHYQAVDLLRYSGGDLKVRIKRRSPRLVESAIPQAQNLGPIIRSRSSSQLPQSPPVTSSRRRSRSISQPRVPSDFYEYPPEEEETGYLRPRSPLGSTRSSGSRRSRRMSSYHPDPYVSMAPPVAPSIISASSLQHTHFDSSGGVHFHPYCFACNPSVIHLQPPTPQLTYPGSYGTPPLSRSNQHIYSQPTSVSGGYPSPIQLRTYGIRTPSKNWDIETTDDDSGRDRITVRLRRDEFNGLGFIVSSKDGRNLSSSGGVFVSGIVKGGVADRSGQLFIGDRILSINGIDVEQARHRDVVALLSRSKPYVQLEIERGEPVSGEYPSDVFESTDDQGVINDYEAYRRNSVSRRSSGRSVDTGPPTRRSSVSRDGPVPPKKSNLKQTSKTWNNDDRRSPSPPPPPPLNLIPSSESRRPVSSYESSDFSFPPPPSDIGRTVETIKKETRSETILTRLTNNVKGKWSIITEDVVIHKNTGSRLGLRIAGGKDSSCIPFGNPEEPGIFISRVIPGGAAARTERLRIGDRILKINEKDVSDWTHPEVIRALCAAPAPEVVLRVRHDPPPPGLDELLIHRREDERYGIKVIGGVREQTAYQHKIYDSGIFVSKVHRGGAIGRDGRVKVGMRLLEVNGTNVIGVTRQEAIEAFRRAGHVLRLLVCDGWNNKEPPLPSSTRNSTAGSVVGEDTHSVTSNFTNSLDRSRRPSSRQEMEDNESRKGSIYSGRSTPTSPLMTRIKKPKEKGFLGIKVSDLTGSRHFPKSPTPSLAGSEKNKEVQTTTIVMSKTESLRPDREVFDEDDDGAVAAGSFDSPVSSRYHR